MVETNNGTRRLLYGTRTIARHMGDEALAPMIRKYPEDWPS
jgi:hypothetical protein